MTLKDDMISDLDVFYDPDDFAKTLTYTPKGGSAIPDINALVLEGEDIKNVVSEYRSGQYDEILFSLREDKIGVVPGEGDKITFNGFIWRFRQTLDHANQLSFWCFFTKAERAVF